ARAARGQARAHGQPRERRARDAAPRAPRRERLRHEDAGQAGAGALSARDARTCMKRVLITGMSGTGKSSVIHELVARGYRAYDLDTPEWSEWVDADPSDALTPAQGKDWIWREDRVHALLSQPQGGTLFVAGCAENMGRLFPLIDAVVLLSA